MDQHLLIACYKEIVNTMSESLMVVGQDGTILMVNNAIEHLTGFSRDELVGSPCTILNCDACDVIRSGSKAKWCRLFDYGKVKGKRCVLIRKDGSSASAIKNASILKDSEGRVLGALEAFTDISEIDRKDRKIEELSRLLDYPADFYGMIGKSASMQRIYQIIQKAGQSDAPVIIYGESGTGKELVAHAIHALGRRRDGPFIQFNCAALNEALMESELFGHTKGAFTGAHRHSVGRFEAADGGDIFLDEIGEISLSTQVKFLRVLETKQIERVGDHRPLNVDIRVIAATNCDLLERVAQGGFRQDLFFRIHVVPIHLPPLRERTEDIPLLVTAFIHQLSAKTGKRIHGVSADVMKLFMRYKWPGNIRELKSALEYAFVITESGAIDLEHLPAQLMASRVVNAVGEEDVAICCDESECEDDEKAALIEALRVSHGNKIEAARILGVHRMTVWNRMKKYGIQLKNQIES